MNMQRIWGVMIRHIYAFPRDMHRMSNLFYWPMIDLVFMGATGLWVQQQQGAHYLLLFVLASALWQFVMRMNLEVSGSMLEEIWANNMSNLFSTPITLPEWVASTALLGVITSGILGIYLEIVLRLVFGVSFMVLGWLLLPLLLLLLVSGFIIGLISAAGLVYLGARAQALVWMISWIFIPICGVFYATTIFPTWLSFIAHLLPMTYIFEVMRLYIASGIVGWSGLIIAALLSVFYVVVALRLFIAAFEKSRELGLSRLAD